MARSSSTSSTAPRWTSPAGGPSSFSRMGGGAHRPPLCRGLRAEPGGRRARRQRLLRAHPPGPAGCPTAPSASSRHARRSLGSPVAGAAASDRLPPIQSVMRRSGGRKKRLSWKSATAAWHSAQKAWVPALRGDVEWPIASTPRATTSTGGASIGARPECNERYWRYRRRRALGSRGGMEKALRTPGS